MNIRVNLLLLTFFLLNNLNALDVIGFNFKTGDVTKKSLSMACLIATPQRPDLSEVTELKFSDRVLLSGYEVDCAQSYNIYRAAYNEDGLEFAILDNTAELQYTDFVDAGSRWVYYVKAVNVKGESYASSEVEVSTTPLDFYDKNITVSPLNLKLIDDENITLSWMAMDDFPTYMVYRDNMGIKSEKFEPLTEWPGINDNSFIDSNITDGINYSYYVASVSNALENSGSYVSRALLPKLEGKHLEILGAFGNYDFDEIDDAFDWVFTTFEGTSYQLQGVPSNGSNIFGWKQVDAVVTNPEWYMLRVGDLLFDWILVSNSTENRSVFKLNGIGEDGSFKYSAKLDVNFTVEDNNISFTAP